MNQILITKKLYVTPELKRKKKIYKFDFILSVFLVIVLISLYIYAEYDRSHEEEVSQEILASIDMGGEDTSESNSDILTVVLNASEDDEITEKPTSSHNNNNSTQETEKAVVTPTGEQYTTSGVINIPAIGVNYPILIPNNQSTAEIERILKISPCKFWGPELNEVGNYCIVGHNYRNSKFFSKVPNLANGDIIEITDVGGRTIQYAVYDKYTVVPTDVSCTSQLTDGKKEVTLITCTNDNTQRVIVKARAI